MRNYLLLKLLLVVLLAVGLFVMFCGWGAIPPHSIMVLGFATFVAAMVIANELRRPMPQEYFRKKALFPKIPNKFLAALL